MTLFAVADLKRILETSSGTVDGVEWDNPATLKQKFEEIGYDSLALLEFIAVVQQEYKVGIPDEAVTVQQTPDEALNYINQRFAEESGEADVRAHR